MLLARRGRGEEGGSKEGIGEGTRNEEGCESEAEDASFDGKIAEVIGTGPARSDGRDRGSRGVGLLDTAEVGI